MGVYYSKKYNYWNADQNIVVFQKKENVPIVSNKYTHIVNHTANTWQKSRTDDEKWFDTSQGKIAEDMFSDVIKVLQLYENIKYLSYDEIREDGLKKHAPFDGLLYKCDNNMIEDCIEKVLEDINNDNFGRILPETREYLNMYNIYTVEIKSSKIPVRDYDSIYLENFNKIKEQRKLITNLRKRDFFVYPEYARDKGIEIRSFYEYCTYVASTNYIYKSITPHELKEKLVEEEISKKSDINIRIFLDFTNTESIIGYLTGYALKRDFFRNPHIMTMPKVGKSEKALYFSYPIDRSKYLTELTKDARLWDN